MTCDLDIVPSLFKPSLDSDVFFSMYCTWKQPNVLNLIKKKKNIAEIKGELAEMSFIDWPLNHTGTGNILHIGVFLSLRAC